MNTLRQFIWLICALGILALSGWYFTPGQKITKLDNETLSSTVDTTISNVTVRQFDAKGTLINLLQTPLMHHIPKGDVNILDTPHIVVAQEGQPPWDIHSLKAKAYEGGKRIVFIEQVVVHQQPGEKTQESTLKTEEVTYYPKEKKATSDLLVTYEQPGNFIQSTGMIAYLDEKRVELLHQARGSYAPPAKG